jgi:hypothetical protein
MCAGFKLPRRVSGKEWILVDDKAYSYLLLLSGMFCPTISTGNSQPVLAF